MASTQKKIYQLRIILCDSWPQIWRVVQVPSTETFQYLNLVIIQAMGWYGCHCHSFRAQNPKTKEIEDIIGDSEWMIENVPKRRKENIAKLKDYLLKEGDFIDYTYDMGDSWDHDIFLENILPPQQGITYPVCIAGERACPPEDCGGISGFEHFLEAIADPGNDEHDDLIEWVGGYYDPDDFDHRQVDFSRYDTKREAFQMKISVKGSDPEIWRRIQIPQKFTFEMLHKTIQRLMEWGDTEPYVFIVKQGSDGKDQETIGNEHKIKGRPLPSKLASMTMVSSHVHWDLKSSYYPFEYNYGFDDDGWKLEIGIEKILFQRANTKYPILLKGEMASPPENCGGIKGYKRLLNTLMSRRSKTKIDVKFLTFDPKYFETMDYELSGNGKKVYQLKISLENTDELIWRRILIPELTTFHELHKVLNRAMGWQNCASYVFVVNDVKKNFNQVIGIDSDENGKYLITKSSKEMFNSLITSVKSQFSYIYNFDEYWDHKVEVEVILPQKLTKIYPQLIDGQGSCPPEQSGNLASLENIRDTIHNTRLDPSSIILAKEQIRIFQFRIVIRGVIKPRIWRRVEVLDNISFKEFHSVISQVVGWKNEHKHLFVVRNPRTCIIERLGDEIPKGREPSTTKKESTKVKELFWDEDFRGIYKYDFRYTWTWLHDIILEEIKVPESGVRYPRFLAGQVACPPEMEKGHTTNFGPHEYYILMNPKHEDHKIMQQIFSNSHEAHKLDCAPVTFSHVE